MVPVQLRLSNFLSYGTNAPTLDFELFQVACLSGKNGQGKSALLDAITWALWGEARKSSGGHKPDDELIRIGTRLMQVEFVFDLEADRYRVVRTYSRSASGKTNRAALELTLYDPAQEDFRPLTGANIRETQAHIDALLGIDYDTFINSAFLLQGRSDEFTKKRPNERKQILTRILNLGKFERLADLAREHLRQATDKLKLAEMEISRLEGALEPVTVWKAEKKDLLAAAERQREVLARLRTEEQALAALQATMEARAREAEALQTSTAALDRRMAQDQSEVEQLNARIHEAEALLAQRDQIERDYDRYEALRAERDQLDTKRELYRGIEKQIEARTAALKDKKNETEKRLHSLDVERRSEGNTLRACTAQLVEAPTLRRMLEKSRAAAVQLQQVSTVRAQREALEEELRACDAQLSEMQAAHEAQCTALEKQIREARPALAELEPLQQALDTLRSQEQEYAALQQTLEATSESGLQLNEKLQSAQGKLEVLSQEVKDQEEALQAFAALDAGACPTCGTELTEAHRAEVKAGLEARLNGLRGEVGRIRAAVESLQAERDVLRQTYRAQQQRAKALADVPTRKATTEARLGQLAEQKERLSQWHAQHAQLREQIDRQAFGPAVREKKKGLGQALAALPFDAAAYAQLQHDASQVDRYEDQLHRLEQVAGQKEQLERSIKQKDDLAATLRRQLDDGTVLGPFQQQIQSLQEQLERVGYAPARLEAVRQALNELAQAGARLKDLLNAQRNQDDWKRQHGRLQERLARQAAEQKDLEARYQAVAAALDGRTALHERVAAKAQERAAAEQVLDELQVQLGQLSARLEQAALDRKTLAAQRKHYNEAEQKRALYTHLRGAFGRNGIPSLIIEQTLPEIEDRANEILERLTEGRMHVLLETLKDKKTGGTRETLEIKITDDQGASRPYETYSGGEAFRVNFALRIALAQLLAERSGVRIRTLVIDEGFGTQDASGVESLVEAIQHIQQDFDKIMVITHLDQLKEAFPIRIEVHKDPATGSSFQMVGI